MVVNARVNKMSRFFLHLMIFYGYVIDKHRAKDVALFVFWEHDVIRFIDIRNAL